MQRWSGRRDSNPVYVSGWCLRQSPCPLPRLGPPRLRPVVRPCALFCCVRRSCFHRPEFRFNFLESGGQRIPQLTQLH